METPSDNDSAWAGASKRVAHQVLLTCENRAALLLVELQEERERILRTIWFGLGAAICTLLACIAITAMLALAFWQQSPIAALLILTAFYLFGAVWFSALLVRIQRDWKTLPSTMDQLRKDREWLEQLLN